jgi:hypothetical protein
VLSKTRAILSYFFTPNSFTFRQAKDLRKLLYLFLLSALYALSCHKAQNSSTRIQSRDYEKAISFLYHRDDSAFYYFNQSVGNSRDSLQIAKAYNYMAQIQSDAGDYYGAQESLTMSLRFLDTADEKDHRCLSSDYNELGLNSLRLRNAAAAIDFFSQAILFSKNKDFQLIALNDKARACQEAGDYANALMIYRNILLRPSPPETFARILTNKAFTQWLQTPAYNAAPELQKALRIRVKEKDLWGQNSSYANLADYYKLSHPDSALKYARQMYTAASQLNSPDDELHALQKLIELEPTKDSRRYFIRYEKLNDSLQVSRNNAKNQFALIRYNAEKAKSDNLKLQKDNSEAKYQILWQRLLIAIIVIGIAVAILFFARWLKKRKHEQEAAKLAAIRDTQLKDAKSVHDTLGNDVYYLLKKVQGDDIPDKGWLVNYINEIYERARDLSREISPETDENFNEYISERLQAFATQDTQVILVGNGKEYWEQVKPVCKVELKHVLQELMVNMGKHSQATRVVIRFEEDGDRRRIYYSDNGVGLPEGKTSGHGLKNTENRIKTIGGELSFGSQANEGLLIAIIFPI